MGSAYVSQFLLTATLGGRSDSSSHLTREECELQRRQVVLSIEGPQHSWDLNGGGLHLTPLGRPREN